MSDARYFVRSRGRITGPFAVEMLVKLVHRGIVTRVDEISEDRRTWARAAEYEELFPAPVRPAPAKVVPVVPAESPAPAEKGGQAAVAVAEPVAPAGEGERFYYQQGGVTVGPVPIGILKSLAENGTLADTDIVWQEGAQTTWQAGHLTQLAPVFYGKNGPRGTDVPASSRGPSGGSAAARAPAVDSSTLRKSLGNVQAVTLLVSVILGVLFLFAIHLPIGSAPDGTPLGWWTVLRSTPQMDSAGALMVAMVLVFSLAAIALFILVPVLRGMPRAVSLVGIGAIGAINYLVGLFTSPSASLTLLGFCILFLVPISAGGIAAIVRARGVIGGGDVGKTGQGVFAGLLGICALTVAIVTAPLLIKGAEFGGLFIGFVLLIISQLVLLGASVLAFVDLKPVFSSALNMATHITARVGLALLLLSFVIIVLDVGSWAGAVAQFEREPNWLFSPPPTVSDARILVLLLGFRVLLVLLYFPIILNLGWEELANVTIVAPVLRAIVRR